MAAALKKKKIKLRRAKLQAKKPGEKIGKKNKREMQVNGSFNHKAAGATGGCYSDSSHLSLGEFSSGEWAWGRLGGLGCTGVVAQVWGLF